MIVVRAGSVINLVRRSVLTGVFASRSAGRRIFLCLGLKWRSYCQQPKLTAALIYAYSMISTLFRYAALLMIVSIVPACLLGNTKVAGHLFKCKSSDTIGHLSRQHQIFQLTGLNPA